MRIKQQAHRLSFNVFLLPKGASIKEGSSMLQTPQNFLSVEFDRDLIARLEGKGPRYTSYPTADRFSAAFRFDDYQANIKQRQIRHAHLPLSLYVHIPFCNTICYYCACNKIITGNDKYVEKYLSYLEKELELYAQFFTNKPTLAQLHFGGGTPTFLTEAQFERVINAIQNVFNFSKDGEYSIEIDPRKIGTTRIEHLKELGFNRLSIGVQDFDASVQQAVNRIQSEEETLSIIQAARDAGFRSISVDLIYGLPHQTLASVQETLRKVLALKPDRLAFYNYAHLPTIFKPQRRIDESALPRPADKLDILQMAVTTLLAQGYVFIGMDHFARPEDDLSLALQNGKLQRNFQGYSTHAEHDMIAIGVSSIGKIGNSYAQNEKDLESYYAALDAGHLPIMRGILLNDEDLLRRQIIQTLMCRFSLSFKEIETKFSINFKEHFKDELKKLKEYEQLLLIQYTEDGIEVTKKGRFLIRTIAMVFDEYLHNKETKAQYSQTI